MTRATPGTIPRSSERPLVMGVLNVTPDSFSDGGRHESVDAAVARALEMVSEGADVIDVGGESTRPGAVVVDPVREQRRVLPVLDAIAESCARAGVRLSIDTRNESTARAAVAVGVTLINDVAATLWTVAAELGVGWVAMHMLGDPTTMQARPSYGDVVSEVGAFLRDRVDRARAAGVTEVWADPGIGFGKTTAHNLALLARLDELVESDTPVVVGTSRKRSLGVLAARSDAGLVAHPGPTGGDAVFDVVEPVPMEDRLTGSLNTASWAMIVGARMVRVHDVGDTVRAAAVVAASGSPTASRSATAPRTEAVSATEVPATEEV